MAVKRRAIRVLRDIGLAVGAVLFVVGGFALMVVCAVAPLFLLALAVKGVQAAI